MLALRPTRSISSRGRKQATDILCSVTEKVERWKGDAPLPIISQMQQLSGMQMKGVIEQVAEYVVETALSADNVIVACRYAYDVLSACGADVSAVEWAVC